MKKMSDPHYQYRPQSHTRRRAQRIAALKRAWGDRFDNAILNWLRSKEAAAEKRVLELQKGQRTVEGLEALVKAHARHETLMEVLDVARHLAEEAND
jgi:hypothetical protein